MQTTALTSEFNYFDLLKALKLTDKTSARTELKKALPAILESSDDPMPLLNSLIGHFGVAQTDAWMMVGLNAGEHTAVVNGAFIMARRLMEAEKAEVRSARILAQATKIPDAHAPFRAELIGMADAAIAHAKPINQITAHARIMEIRAGDKAEELSRIDRIVSVLERQRSTQMLADKTVYPAHALAWEAMETLGGKIAGEGTLLRDAILNKALAYTDHLPPQDRSAAAKHVMDYAPHGSELQVNAIEKSLRYLPYRKTAREQCGAAQYLWHRADGDLKKRIGETIVGIIEGPMPDTEKYEAAIDFMEDLAEHMESLSKGMARDIKVADSPSAVALQFLGVIQDPDWNRMMLRVATVAQSYKPAPVTLEDLPDAIAALKK